MTAQEIISSMDSFPPVSPAGLKLINLLNEPDHGNEDIIQTLKRDTVLTAKVLKACNSPAYGFKENIASVDRAVLMLGYEKVERLVLALSFGSAMTTTLSAYAFEPKELWRHSFVTATVAETLTLDGLFINIEPATAFTAGLLHDIGKLICNSVLADDLTASLRHEIEANGLSRLEAEQKTIGTDHAEVGACLLKSWGLPAEIIEGVAHHHQPVFEPQPKLSAVTCIANSIAHLAGSAPGWEAYADKINNALIDALYLTPEKVENLIIEARDSFDRVERFLVVS